MSHALTLTTFALGSLVLLATGGADGGAREPEPTATVTAPAADPAWTRGGRTRTGTS
jgi:hypothetical protein